MKSRLMILAVAAFYGASYAHADSLTFEQLVQQALLTSPEAAKIDATLAERAAEAFSIKVKENPVLSAGIDIPIDRPEGEDPELSLTLSQAIRPSDFGERTALATLIEETAGTEKVIALNEFILNVGVLYSRAWQLQETESLYTDARSRIQQVLKKVSEGASKGVFPEGDIELFKAELKTFEAEAIATRSELSRTRSELTKLSGTSVSDKTLAKPSDDSTVSRETLERLVRENKLPIQIRFNLLRKLSQQQLEVARLDSAPVIAPLIGVGRHDDGTSQVMLGFSIPLPVFNRNQSEIIRAEGARAAAEKGAAYASSDAIVSESLRLFEAVTGMHEQVELYEKGVIPAKRKAVDAYSRGFDAGIGSVFQLWQSQRELNQSRLRLVELRGALAGAHAQINALIGQQRF